MVLKHEALSFKEMHLKYAVPAVHHLVKGGTTACTHQVPWLHKLSSQMRRKASPMNGGGTVGVATLTKKGQKVSANGATKHNFQRVMSLTQCGFR
jgi:hypothetical protein